MPEPETLRSRLAHKPIVVAPGVYDPFTSLVATQAGFETLYVSGAAIAYTRLGRPDIGLVSMTEVTETLALIRDRVSAHLIVDGDTGYGNALNVVRTIREFERAGATAIQLEDQDFPKRCGHLDNKDVVPVDVMVRRIKAAVEARKDENFTIMARTDARGIEGLDAAIDRAKAYVDAGADAIFPEAMKDESDFEAFRKGVDVPILANMTEFGKSDLLTTKQMQDLGINIVIYPVTSLRIAMGAVESAFERIRDEGTQEGVVPQMQTRARLYELLNYEEYNKFDTSIFNFKV